MYNRLPSVYTPQHDHFEMAIMNILCSSDAHMTRSEGNSSKETLYCIKPD